MRRVLVPLCLSIFYMSPAIADPALTAKPSILRETANSHGKVIRAIPGHVRVDINNCEKAWCFISWRGKFGYIPVSAIAMAAQEQPQADAYPPDPYPPRPPVGAPYHDGPQIELYGDFDYGYGYGRYGDGWGYRH